MINLKDKKKILEDHKSAKSKKITVNEFTSRSKINSRFRQEGEQGMYLFFCPNEICKYQLNYVLFSSIGTKYEYELWVPQLQRFQTVTQVFKQFPEYKWNKADVVLEDASQELDSMINLKSCIF